MPIRILQIWDEPDISERMSCEVSVTFMKILQIIFSKLEKNHILSFPHISTNINLISSGVHWFWRVEFWILNIEYLFLFFACKRSGKNLNKYSKFDKMSYLPRALRQVISTEVLGIKCFLGTLRNSFCHLL